MSARTILPVHTLDSAAEASGVPGVFADALSLLLSVERRESDLAGVRGDLDRCPATPVGRALARRWNADCQRREIEIVQLRSHLERLRRDAPGTVAQACAWFAERSPMWVEVPGGRVRDEA
jgi:hypothetical protein